MEIPTHPREGVDLGALAQAITKHNVRACWFMTTFQNPLGASLPEEKKRDLVELLAEHEIPLIEDDVYAELNFDKHRPKPAKAFDRKGLVLNCGSFSKRLAPGYRLGWTAAGRFTPAVQRRKVTTSLATSVPIQNGIAQMLRNEGYDRHLEKLRQALRSQQGAALAFPEATLSVGLPGRDTRGRLLPVDRAAGAGGRARSPSTRHRGSHQHRARSDVLGAPAVPQLPALELWPPLDRPGRRCRG